MISTSVLRQMAAAGAVNRVSAQGVPGGFVLSVRVGMDEQLLAAQRGGARRFKRLDALAKYLQTVGIRIFDVDTVRWDSKGLV